ncbi:MAG TPA: hypothetical protein VHD33_00785, partial [Legionellaceae bacterium]|nr:hypothetical protein [Legionellaceae bacterium]
TWLSTIVMALVTLRKGTNEGGRLLLGIMLAHTAMSLSSLPLSIALLNSVILFVPCYIAACTLRMTSNWLAVAAVLFFLVIMSSLLIQQMIPEWITSQYALIQSIMKQSQPDQVFSKWLENTANIHEESIANYVFGIQLMSAVISVLFSLLTARSLQSQLYYPGGFKQELLTFRGNRMACIVMLALLAAAWQWNAVAINVILVLSLFYMLAGMSLAANLLIGKTSRMVLVLLIVPLLFIPFVMVPLYIIMGLLDSIFNIRMAFAVKRG